MEDLYQRIDVIKTLYCSTCTLSSNGFDPETIYTPTDWLAGGKAET